MELTDQQKRVLEHPYTTHGCILAGPGTGKSTTVIAYASRVREARQANLRILTFTRAATAELAAKILSAGSELPRPSTIHSFAIATLLRNPGSCSIPEPLRLLNDWEWNNLMRPRLAKALGLSRGWREVDRLKLSMAAGWESLEEEVPDDLRAKFISAWQDQRTLFGYTLLSELPYRLREALMSHPDLELDDLNLLIVDEYQDLNPCDLDCLNRLSLRGVTLVAVGDDDQSIYSFRKAHPKGLRTFPKTFNATEYPLTVTQRFGANILRWANYVINGDPGRMRKPELTVASGLTKGEVAYLEFPGEVAEALGVADLVTWLSTTRSVPLNEILVLSRSDFNGQFTKRLKEELDSRGIGHASPDTIKELLNEAQTVKLLTGLRLLADKNDGAAWLTVLHFVDGIGHAAIEATIAYARGVHRRFGDAIVKGHEEGELETHVGKGVAGQVAKTISWLASIEVPTEAKWGSWILRLIDSGRLPKCPEPLREMLAKMDDIVEEGITLDRFVSQIHPVLIDLAASERGEAVRIMTIASSKGLTTTVCIVMGCEAGVIPLEREGTDVHEERRLLYVAMTRASEYLFLTRARRRKGATARVGGGRVQERRPPCPFLEGGPVHPQDGDDFIRNVGILKGRRLAG